MSPDSEPLPLEDLLRRRRWLRALVREMVRDPWKADDVEQETWLTALRRPPRREWGLGAWLATVARSRATDLHRAEHRRVARERAVAADEGVPDGTEALSRVELQRAVADAVLSLEDTYRTVVVQRYFEGKSARSIAKDLEIPVETVRTRLKRAHALLRERLDTTYEGGRRRWTLACVPLLEGGWRSWILGGLVQGVLWMKAKKVVVGLVLLLTLTAGTAAYLSRTHERPAGSGESILTAEADRTAKGPTLEGARTEDPGGASAMVVDTANPGLWQVEGTVRDLTYAGVPGVAVRARRFPGYLSEADWQGRAAALDTRVTTDDRGRFRLVLPVPTSPGTLVLVVESPRHRSFPRVDRFGPGSPPPRPWLLVHVLDRVVSGRVLDEAGAPLADAQVSFADRDVSAAPDGTYRIEVSPVRGFASLVASAPGRAAVTTQVRVVSAETKDVEFRLPREVVVRGRITTARGGPASGAVVWAPSVPRRWAAVADSDGRYEVGRLTPGRAETLHVFHASHASTTVAVPALEAASSPFTRDIVLPEGPGIEGLVETPEGAPASRVHVTCGFDPNAWNVREAWTDEDGTYRFEAVDTGTMFVVARKPGFGAAVLQQSVSPDTRSFPTLRLGRAQSASGTVVTPEGRPIPNAYVGLQAWEKISVGNGFTDEKGEFSIDDLPAGTHSGTISAHGFEIVRSVAVVAGSKDHRIVLQPTMEFGGVVVDAASGEPVTDFAIHLLVGADRSGLWPGQGRFNAPEGRWTTAETRLPTGQPFTFLFVAPGHAPLAVLAPSPPSTSLRVELGSGATITGTVRDAGGEPVPDVSLQFAWEGMGALADPRYVRAVLSHQPAKADANGRFTLEHLPAGRTTLAVEATGYLPLKVTGIETAEGARLERDVVLERGAGIEGQVLDREERARPGLSVRVSRTDAPPSESRWVTTLTDAEGRFHLEGLHAGRHIVSLDVTEPRSPTTATGANSYTEFAVRVELASGVVLPVTLRSEGGGAVACRVVGAAVPGVIVTLERLGDAGNEVQAWHRAPLQAEGTVRFAHLPLGRYRVGIDHHDAAAHRRYHAPEQEIRVEGGETRVVLEVSVRGE